MMDWQHLLSLRKQGDTKTRSREEEAMMWITTV